MIRFFRSVRTGLAPALFATLLAAYSASQYHSEGKPAQPSRIAGESGTADPLDPASPLGFAFNLHARIEEADHRARTGLALIRQLLDAGHREQAVEAAGRITGYNRGIAYARIALYDARRGDRDAAREMLSKAREARFQDYAWQNEAISAETVPVYVAMEDRSRADDVRFALEDRAAIATAQALFLVEMMRSGQEYSLDLHPAVRRKESDHMIPEMIVVARALLEIVSASAHSDPAPTENPALLALCDEARQLLEEARSAAGEEYLNLGILYRTLGHTQKGGEMVARSVAEMPVGSDMSGWEPGHLAKLVRLYADERQPDIVEKMMESARASVGRLHPYFRPLAFIQIADAELALGREAEGDAAFADAMAAAMEHQNPDVRVTRATDLALAIGRAKRAVPDDVASTFRALLQGGDTGNSVP